MQFKQFFRGLVGAAALAVVAFPAAALEVNPATGNGQKYIYVLDNGNRLGLVGLQGLSDLEVTPEELRVAVVAGTAINWYFANPQSDDYGTKSNRRGAWDGAPVEFTKFTETTNIAQQSGGDKLFDALWVEYDEQITFTTGNGTTGFGKNDTVLTGDPISAIPLPAGLPLMATMIAGFAVAARARKRA